MFIDETGHRVRLRRCLHVVVALALSLPLLDVAAARAEANGPATLGGATPAAYHPPIKADRIVVLKSRRVLELLKDGKVVKTYPIALGEHPRGAKHSVGDGRTPEGTYYIDARQPHSRYHLALHISYPNAADTAQAVSAGRDPGGNIMIHGLPAWYRGPDPERFYKDWTDGCVSVGDAAIEEIYAAVDVGTPIEIKP
jgi:murein L,D-transpeptidase YafK